MKEYIEDVTTVYTTVQGTAMAVTVLGMNNGIGRGETGKHREQ